MKNDVRAGFMRSRFAPLVSIVALTLAPAQVRAQAQLAPRDSLRILSNARTAQFNFEVARRLNLPRLQPSDQPPCDAIIGRMCYWNEDDSNDDDPNGIAEPATISRARRRLIGVLNRASAQSPADTWIAGQRVRYLVESGDDSAAVTAGRECRSAQWWCDVLQGYALHSAGDYAASEATFDAALSAMPHDVRCKWTDIAVLLTDVERDEYQRLPCDARHAVEQRFWKLAQPSYTVRGNDRRTEHFSRILLADLLSSSANAYGLQWADDMREILIRYGMPSWYATTWSSGLGSSMGTIGHDRRHGYHFAATTDRDGTRWDIHAKTPRERYSAPYMDSVVDLNAQFAMLKRGDSAVLVAIYADAEHPESAVLGLAGDSGMVLVTRDSVHARVRRARAPWKEVVAGVEDYDPVRRIDARARTWIAPPVRAPGAPELSTLLLFAGDAAGNTGSLEDALAHALTTDEIGGSRKLGLYWEMYAPDSGAIKPRRIDSARTDSSGAAPIAPIDGPDSLAPDSSISPTTTLSTTPATAPATAPTTAPSTAPPTDVSITITRTDGGVLKWLAQALRMTPKDSRIAMQWHETQINSGVIARSVVLDLAQLPPGTYRITLAAGPDDAHRTTTWREIRLR